MFWGVLNSWTGLYQAQGGLLLGSVILLNSPFAKFRFPVLVTTGLCCSHRAKAQALIQNLSLLLVDASVGTIQCLEEIVSPLSPFLIPQLQLVAVPCVRRSAQLHREV